VKLAIRIGANDAGRHAVRVTCAALAILAACVGTGAAAAPGKARLRAPVPSSPASAATVEALPTFAWSPVRRADAYEFQVAADAGFNSPVLGRGKDHFTTRNSRATLLQTVPNGTYYWRVRAVTEAGATSPWTRPQSFRKRWSGAAVLQSPATGSMVSFPATPLRLSWSAVPGAASYRVSIATDPLLGSLVGGKTTDTFATTFTRAAALAAGTYYWGVTPLDARGNPGVASAVSSFAWVWPSATTTRLSDLAPEAEIFDPEFSWDPVAGAARYEVEVNASDDFAAGSKVCCTSPTIASSLSPTKLLKDNRYYWRIRAIDPEGNAGVWNYGPAFEKRFDKVPPVEGASIRNVHMRDNIADPGIDTAPGTPGYQTNVPIVAWDPVPGASSYLVDVARFQSDMCQWATSPWTVTTAVPAWTPLAAPGLARPYPDALSIAGETFHLQEDESYCVRVRARSDRDAANQDVYGDFAYLDDGRGLGIAFTWTGPPAGTGCSAPCAAGYLGRGDYVLPGEGVHMSRTPLFTWRALAGKQSYFVIVAKDSSFSNVVDYAFTRLPAHAPRRVSRPTTYSDELTSYYWVVLPASSANGSDAVGNPLVGSPGSFQKRSAPPTLLAPGNLEDLLAQPSFRWTTAEGARRYRLQVAQDPTFGSPIEDVVTNATAYTSNTTYPADTLLYWRVRADDENLVGLTWSAMGAFRKRLATPVLDAGNAGAGDFIPTWTWQTTAGAVSYDVAVDLPDGTHRDLKALPTAAVTPLLMYGTGSFRWKVRANFPTASGVIAGPYSPTTAFIRTIGEPGGAHASVSKSHLALAWNAKAGAKEYRVQISSRTDFARLVENITTDNTSYAPLLTHAAYREGGSLYWRVAAVDAGNNVGDFTAAQRIGRPKSMRVRASRALVRGRSVTVTVTVLDARRRPVRLARVRVTGRGVRPAVRRTTRAGTTTFTIRAKRSGTVIYQVTKTGFAPAVLRQRIS
jgi:hypothetical protein